MDQGADRLVLRTPRAPCHPVMRSNDNSAGTLLKGCCLPWRIVSAALAAASRPCSLSWAALRSSFSRKLFQPQPNVLGRFRADIAATFSHGSDGLGMSAPSASRPASVIAKNLLMSARTQPRLTSKRMRRVTVIGQTPVRLASFSVPIAVTVSAVKMSVSRLSMTSWAVAARARPASVRSHRFRALQRGPHANPFDSSRASREQQHDALCSTDTLSCGTVKVPWLSASASIGARSPSPRRTSADPRPPRLCLSEIAPLNGSRPTGVTIRLSALAFHSSPSRGPTTPRGRSPVATIQATRSVATRRVQP